MKIEKVKIDRLVYDPNNARKHGARNLDAIKGSLAKFGQQKPIVIDKNNVVIAGNGTLAAAVALGWPTLNAIRTDLEGFNAAAFAIADNRTSELAEWDLPVLSDTLKDLAIENFNLGDIGFDQKDLDKLIKVVLNTDPNEHNAAHVPDSTEQVHPTPNYNQGQELNQNEFQDFAHQCPKCGFEFSK